MRRRPREREKSCVGWLCISSFLLCCCCRSTRAVEGWCPFGELCLGLILFIEIWFVPLVLLCMKYMRSVKLCLLFSSNMKSQATYTNSLTELLSPSLSLAPVLSVQQMKYLEWKIHSSLFWEIHFLFLSDTSTEFNITKRIHHIFQKVVSASLLSVSFASSSSSSSFGLVVPCPMLLRPTFLALFSD